jgi:uncharacterized protein DUF1566
MGTLITELRSTIVRHVDKASRHELASIVGALCAHEDVAELIRTEPTFRVVGPRFEVDGETVRDESTGLVWTQANVAAKQLTWKEAEEACAKLELAGGGWRLPTIKELLTLVDYERSEPAIDPAFSCESSWYWTSTPYASSPGEYAWSVNFGYGYSYWGSRSNGGFVRAVRASQS